MLALHSWVQPYKKRWHNRLDTFIFNGITQYNYKKAKSLFNNELKINILSTIQVLLAYSSIVFMIIYILVKLKTKTHIFRYLRKKVQEENELDISLSMFRQNTDTRYQKFA